MESVFGICLGCIIYKRLNIKLYKCPGDVCEVPKKKKSKRNKVLLLLVFIILFFGVFEGLKKYKYHNTTSSKLTQEQIDDMEFQNADEEEAISSEEKDCNPPQWAIDMGHREMWLEHNGCK